MSGADDRCGTWCDALLRDDHEVAALLVVDGVVARSNQAAQALFPDVRAGVRVEDLFEDSSRGKVAGILAPRDAATVTELQASRRDALPAPVHLLALPVRPSEIVLVAGGAGPPFAAEKIAGKLLAANDALVEMTRRLSRDVRAAETARDALTQLDSLRELFLTAAAHDLRSPLDAIMLSEESLRSRPEPVDADEIQRHAERVTRNVRRLLELIDGLLLSARLDSGEPGIPREEIALDEIALQVADDLRPLAEAAGVRLDVLATSACLVLGSRVWLREVFVNLVSNAIRYAPRDTPVEVCVRLSGDVVRCEVSDQGPGVPAAERETVFERFAQHGSRRGVGGLGLHISRRVLEQHQGRIWIDEGPAGGARLVFELPAARPVREAAGPTAPH